MIVSASRRTDIPAFYADWFRKRLRAGFCKVANPFNPNQRLTVSLRPEEVDALVFWTKNPAPFMDVLDEVHERGLAFIVQYTITGYPRLLESRVVDASRSVRTFRTITEKFGSRVGVWRYDTVVLSSLTNADFHRRNFERLATQLKGATDEVVVSFLEVYSKTRRNLCQAASAYGFQWEEPLADTKRALLSDLSAIAAGLKIRLSLCAQPQLLVDGVGEARCVDAQRLMDVAGHPFAAKLKRTRKGCGCFESTDIGAYDTCPHGCLYCYAVCNRSLALKRYEAHDPEGEYLFPEACDGRHGDDCCGHASSGT